MGKKINVGDTVYLILHDKYETDFIICLTDIQYGIPEKDLH